MFVFTTRLPLASIICANDHPKRLLRTCPKCSGLLVFGEEYSIITNGDRSVAFFSPKCGSLSISLSSPSHAFCDMTRFRKPLTTLYDAMASQCSAIHAPISSAVSSGFFFDVLSSGNTTRVRLPSNSFFVFCSCSRLSSTSAPYRAFIASLALWSSCSSIFIFTFLLFGCKVTNKRGQNKKY